MSNSDSESPRIISIGHIDLGQLKKQAKPNLEALPLLPTQNLVLFPGITIPISLVRETSQKIARAAEESGCPIGVVCQSTQTENMPQIDDLYPYGVIAEVIKVIELPDGSHTAIVRGFNKFKIEQPILSGDDSVYPLLASVKIEKETKPKKNDRQFIALSTRVKELTIKLLKQIGEGATEMVNNLDNFGDPVSLVNFICTQSPFPPEIKIRLLAQSSITGRTELLLEQLTEQEQMLEVTEKIQSHARANFEQQHRTVFLQNQMEAIKQELYGDDNTDQDELRQRGEETLFTDSAAKVFQKELGKLGRLNPQSPEYAVQFQYLETLLDLPWQKYSEMSCDFNKARKTLDDSHFGLKKVKERILEQIAVLMNNPGGKSPILCLVGPPGVGKTSIGQAIADALSLKYERVSLGGMHDEAEIRGHRRTYIGSMPGRIIDAIKRAGTSNPVILLDEVDKIGADFKGDPSAALLEVLDPEQNWRFHDNYIDVDYDLSKVLFIATANTLSTLSQPLLDRLEIIELPGYLLEEKVEIASNYIIPRLRKNNNLKSADLVFTKDIIAKIVENYTSESGVRQLEKALSAIIRKTILAKVQGTPYPKRLTSARVEELLGVPRYSKEHYEGNDFAGVVTGLAWTAVGGEILYIETSIAQGKGEKLTLTGNLGNVMKESATIACQWVKSNCEKYGLKPEDFENAQIHIHVPEGAIPKDGPSAGITMATSIVSAFTKRKVKNRLAMTGEITLRGKVMPVGGIKEKILAAKRAGITEIILSSENKKDISDIDRIYIEGLKFNYVGTISEVLDLALLDEKQA
ncbi:MAG: endopeptidase La [Muribaculum sp.]|nr:endopeptidase La [Muribaculaceae bacterium]MCM1080687.1 endopeptidase La [Muribaculum sp.]